MDSYRAYRVQWRKKSFSCGTARWVTTVLDCKAQMGDKQVYQGHVKHILARFWAGLRFRVWGYTAAKHWLGVSRGRA